MQGRVYREAMRFEHAFMRYQLEFSHWGRVPKSREVILEEARRSPLSAVDLLWRKIARLEP